MVSMVIHNKATSQHVADEIAKRLGKPAHILWKNRYKDKKTA